MLDKKSIKLEVSAACAVFPGLANAITRALGKRPLWSKLDIIDTLRVWLAYKTLYHSSALLEVTPPGRCYYEAFLALGALPEVQANEPHQDIFKESSHA